MSLSVLQDSMIMVGFDDPGITLIVTEDIDLEEFTMESNILSEQESLLKFHHSETFLGSIGIALSGDLISVSVFPPDSLEAFAEYEFFNSSGSDVFDYCNNVNVSNGSSSFDVVNGNSINKYSV